MNPLFRNSLIVAIKGAVAEAEPASEMDHTYLRGKMREIALDGLIKPWLTNLYATGSGKVTDSKGKLSGEVDVIIFAKNVIPPLIYSADGFGIYPCEACMATIEVKSKLTAAELKNSLDSSSLLSANEMEFQSGTYDASGTETVPHGFIETARTLFAFSSDLGNNGKTEIQRYLEHADESTGKQLQIICVVGKGCWVQRRHPSGQLEWVEFSPTEDYDEVIAFCTVLADGLESIRCHRGTPPISTYIGRPAPKPAT